MSSTVDANILIYASNASDPLHADARALLAALAAGPDLVYLFWPVTMGYLRIVTHPGILPRPLGAQVAEGNIASLLALPHVRAPGEPDDFWQTYTLTAGPDTRGNLVPDAHLAALMRRHGVSRIYTRDRDFRRFDGIEPLDPFASASAD